jgi:DNA-directed RNA polymerase specialized sigma subunit
MIFKSNKDRAAYWKQIKESYSDEEINQALSTLKPQTLIIIKMRYQEERSFPEIAELIDRSISIARNHHNRGIFLLQKYFSQNVSAEKNQDQLEKKFRLESFESELDR